MAVAADSIGKAGFRVLMQIEGISAGMNPYMIGNSLSSLNL
jgi:hypothetical protein